jgi:CHAD domain-containing protein
VTLRRRRGESDEGWQLKVPAGDARTELRLPLGDGRAVPAELREATLALRAGGALQQLATLVTERQVHRVRAADGLPLAEIVVDTVSATPAEDRAAQRRWREVEVELNEGDETLLPRAAEWLTRHGADPSSSSSKLARALDTGSRKPLDAGELAGLICAYLDEQFDALVAGDIALRRGEDAIHRTRVATRRYRSVLRVLGNQFDAERAVALDNDLRWFAAALGEVRDKQVLRKHLHRELDELPPELILGPVSARIDRMLAAEEQEAVDRLAKLMRTQRYFGLWAQLRDWHDEPPLVRHESARRMRRYGKKAQRKVRKRLEDAPDTAGRDEALHRARKAAKRARYIAELSAPVLGAAAESTVDRMKKLQDRLGLRQDRVVAAEFLRRAGAGAATGGENGFTFGLLYERQLARVREDDLKGSYL